MFDLLGFGGRDLRTLTYLERREHLDRLGLPHGPVLLSPSYRDIPVSRMLAVAAEHNIEGVIGKTGICTSAAMPRNSLFRTAVGLGRPQTDTPPFESPTRAERGPGDTPPSGFGLVRPVASAVRFEQLLFDLCLEHLADLGAR
ncbi:hypothetical protein ACIRRA_43865 [Nocardia sp. NPDC101769]|uniref:hypothetical protein n=1 Tax=Nocardia sp. NPDC101769 TaxID=3364333 RepID=UPI003820D7FA